MGLLLWITLGALVGWIVPRIFEGDREHDTLRNIFVGIVGAVVGGVLISTFDQSNMTTLNPYGAVIAILGAVALLSAKKTLQGV